VVTTASGMAVMCPSTAAMLTSTELSVRVSPTQRAEQRC
jgi:hypothetical protein